jgi:predicted RNase H-like nuclease (RuvC/YqgF family)
MSIPLSTIPCLFVIALIFGILGITLSAVAYSQAKAAKAQTGLIIAALIISILGTTFALLRFTKASSNRVDIVNHWKSKLEEFEEHSDEFESNFEDAFREGFEDGMDEEVQSMEEELESLEEELEELGEEIEIHLDDLSDEEQAKKLGRATGKAVREFIDELKDTTESD